MRKSIKFIVPIGIICTLLLFFALNFNVTQLNTTTYKSFSYLLPNEVEKLVIDMPAMKVRTYRYSPEALMISIKNILVNPEYSDHKEIFEALIKFMYLSQVVSYQNKSTKSLIYDVEELVQKFEMNGALNDFALVELLKLIHIHTKDDSETLDRIINTKDYPFPAYKFLAKYLYVNVLKKRDEEKKIKYEKEMHKEAFKTWTERLPENIIGNKNSLIAISQALEADEDSFFDFMYYFNLLYLNKNNNIDDQLTDFELEKYINLLSSKFSNYPYFINNFKAWFLSVMTPGHSYAAVNSFFYDILSTGTNQQKAIAFEHFSKQIKFFPAKHVPLEYIKQFEQLIEILKSEEDYYGLRGVALGYLNANNPLFSNKQALNLLQYVIDNTKDEQLKQLIVIDIKKWKDA